MDKSKNATELERELFKVLAETIGNLESVIEEAESALRRAREQQNRLRYGDG